MMYIKIGNRKMKDMGSIHLLSQAIAHYFPQPDQFVTGIHELLLNAVEHGNLGIGFATKTELIRRGIWREEVARRLALPENTGKEVEIRLTYDETECRLIICDQGNGFAWKDYVDGPAGTRQLNGRGLRIALNSQFDRLSFNPAGNEVTCVAKYSRWVRHPLSQALTAA